MLGITGFFLDGCWTGKYSATSVFSLRRGILRLTRVWVRIRGDEIVELTFRLYVCGMGEVEEEEEEKDGYPVPLLNGVWICRLHIASWSRRSLIGKPPSKKRG